MTHFFDGRTACLLARLLASLLACLLACKQASTADPRPCLRRYLPVGSDRSSSPSRRCAAFLAKGCQEFLKKSTQGYRRSKSRPSHFDAELGGSARACVGRRTCCALNRCPARQAAATRAAVFFLRFLSKRGKKMPPGFFCRIFGRFFSIAGSGSQFRKKTGKFLFHRRRRASNCRRKKMAPLTIPLRNFFFVGFGAGVQFIPLSLSDEEENDGKKTK